MESNAWKQCAVGGIRAEVIERCAGGELGSTLLARSIRLANVLNIVASPTWLANNGHKFNAITAEAIKTNLCQHNKIRGCDKILRDSVSDSIRGSCSSQ